MAVDEVIRKLEQRSGTEAEWAAADPTLLAGEFGYCSDGEYFKVGDGTHSWSEIIDKFRPSKTKVYRALPLQSGTGVPTSTIIENTLGGTPVWSRVGIPGWYYLDLAGAFPAGKLINPGSPIDWLGSTTYSIQRVSDDRLIVITYAVSFSTGIAAQDNAYFTGLNEFKFEVLP